MRRWSVMSLFALAVVSVVAIAGCGSSGPSSNGSSGWSSSQVEQVEGKIANVMTENGLTPSKSQTGCMVAGLERMGVSASEVLGNAEASSDQKSEIDELLEECTGLSTSPGADGSASDEGIEEEAEETLSGPACQEDLESEGCREEATQKEDEIAEREGLTPPEE